jgi:hypothetical protein
MLIKEILMIKNMYDLSCIAKVFTVYEADDLCKMRRHTHDQK